MKEMTESYGGHCEREPKKKKNLTENVKEEKGMTVIKKGKQKRTNTITIREGNKWFDREEKKKEKKEEEKDEKRVTVGGDSHVGRGRFLQKCYSLLINH